VRFGDVEQLVQRRSPEVLSEQKVAPTRTRWGSALRCQRALLSSSGNRAVPTTFDTIV